MISPHFSAMWTAAAPALGDHLWQSTLFAITAGLLILTLRKNHARIRYRLWLAASMKFLIPFSLLIGLGSHLAWFHRSAAATPGFYSAIEDVSQPFTQPALFVVPQATPVTVFSILLHLLPAFLATLWLCGFLAVLFAWYARWRGVSKALRIAEPLQEGRELDTLRHLERTAGNPKPIEIFLSRASLEPGIFGIVRPVLLWPAGISDRLEDAHLEAILAHELWHVRRRDNLAAALHMLVEAIFWFHPLVWWLGSRLVEERELACDEAVLQWGSDRQVYAESILKICEFCVGSPLACVSGVTGADLKKRMVHIMTKSSSRKLDFGRKLLLSAAGLVAVIVPIVFGLVKPTRIRAESLAQTTAAGAPAFESATIKPNNGTPMAGFSIVGKPFAGIMWKADHFMATNFTLQKLIQHAYDIEEDRITGGQAWFNSEGYDIDARVDKSAMDQLQKLSPELRSTEKKRMVQALLADHFKLALHRETREVPILALVIAENGPKLLEAKPGDTYANGVKGFDGRPIGGGTIVEDEKDKLVGQGIPIASLVRDLSHYYVPRTILDKTGLKGNYDFTLQWKSGNGQAPIFTAIQDQLGLKLEPQTARLEVLVIDHVEMPSDSHTQITPAIPPVFAVASVKLNKAGTSALETGGIVSQRLNIGPGTFSAENISMGELIRSAYGVNDYQVSGAPNWFSSDLYDVDAKAEQSVINEMQKLGDNQRALQNQRMLQALLNDRFRLAVRQVTKDLPAYSLVVAEDGKLHEAQGDCSAGPHDMELGAHSPPPCGSLRVFPWVGRMDGVKVPITQLAANLSGFTKRAVLDNTNLTGKYDINLKWFPSPGEFPLRPAYLPATYQPDPNSPTLQTAIRQQLGLKLESKTSLQELLVIDHVEKPSSN